MARRLLPDEVWAEVAPLLPRRRPNGRGGRPAVRDRAALTGILFVLKTGIPWEMLPEEMGCGCGMTCLRRLREWQRAGVWTEVQRVLSARLTGAERIDWSRTEHVPSGTVSRAKRRAGRSEHQVLTGRWVVGDEVSSRMGQTRWLGGGLEPAAERRLEGQCSR